MLKFKKNFPDVWFQIITLAVSLTVFALILLNRSPNVLRPLSMSLRTGFGVAIPFAALLIYLSFRIPGRAGGLTSMVLTASLFAMPLAGLWASGLSQSVAISGLIPLADASYYYHDSIRIILGRDISTFSAMRPFYAGFLSLLMSFTGRNFMVSMAIITAFAAVAVYYAVREFQRTHGVEVAAFILMMLFLYLRYHSGTSMSENLGVPVGVLGFSLIWRGMEKRSKPLSLFGLFLAAFALNIRPGAMFVLPFILLSTAWVFKKPEEYISISYLLLGAIFISLSFVLNFALIRILADPSGTAFSNFSWALYGLASGGKSFNYFSQVYPDIFALQDPERSRIIYRMAFELILQNPGLFAEGLAQRWGMFFSDSWYSAFSFVGGETYSINYAARIILYGLSAFGFLKWALSPRDPYSGLVSLAAVGVLLSVPFVPPTDAHRVRLYAATMIVFALLPGMGLSLILGWLSKTGLIFPQPKVQPANTIVVFSAAYVLLILIAPLLVKAWMPSPPDLQVMCPAEKEKVIVRFDPGSYIKIMRQRDEFLDWMPNFHQGVFNRSIHGLPDSKFIHYLESLDPETVILSSVDYLSDRPALIVAPLNQMPPPGSYMGLCGYWETESVLEQNQVFFAEQVIPLEQ